MCVMLLVCLLLYILDDRKTARLGTLLSVSLGC